jgi:hypothetical protein
MTNTEKLIGQRAKQFQKRKETKHEIIDKLVLKIHYKLGIKFILKIDVKNGPKID